eukprot:CAMPEP_0196825028 /NCGR_PEP_ID=MMETSP1362-20130617/92817_1 /TAXON_ID=163516 /ORGANISM="Leptocylindrus danicus, Strain CCMP1856" /LENGTH=283 /DNA_ID=CAMNT_0042205393 /DNA_START=69 /DNA_END=920 /DNA_ORIENTATION=-
MKVSLPYAIIFLGSITMGTSAAFVVLPPPQQNQHVFGVSVHCPGAKAKNMGITNTNTNTNSRLSSSTKLNGQKLLRYDEKYGSLEKAGVCMDLEPVKNKQTTIAAKPIAALNMKQTGNKPKGLRYDAKYGDLEKAAVLMEPAPVTTDDDVPVAEVQDDDDSSSSSAPDYASEKQAGGVKQTGNNKPKGLRYDAKYGDLEKAAVLMEPAAAAAAEPARDDEDSSSSAPDYASEKQAGGGMVVAAAPKAPKAPAHQKKVMDPYESCLKYDKKYGDLEKAGVLMDF